VYFQKQQVYNFPLKLLVIVLVCVEQCHLYLRNSPYDPKYWMKTEAS
jgi:hypothetical protein